MAVPMSVPLTGSSAALPTTLRLRPKAQLGCRRPRRGPCLRLLLAGAPHLKQLRWYSFPSARCRCTRCTCWPQTPQVLLTRPPAEAWPWGGTAAEGAEHPLGPGRPASKKVPLYRRENQGPGGRRGSHLGRLDCTPAQGDGAEGLALDPQSSRPKTQKSIQLPGPGRVAPGAWSLACQPRGSRGRPSASHGPCQSPPGEGGTQPPPQGPPGRAGRTQLSLRTLRERARPELRSPLGARKVCARGPSSARPPWASVSPRAQRGVTAPPRGTAGPRELVPTAF